jgi:Ca2+-binding EF-hand superfamily protein
MRAILAGPALLGAALMAGAAGPPQTSTAPDGPDLLVPGAAGPTRLRLEVVSDGRPQARAWEGFLDKLFDHYDRDGDGALSAAEAARVFPLPLPGGREVALDFAKADADKDGKVSRAELKSYYRRAGFAPVVLVVEPPAAEALRLGEALFRHLDRDGDGKLTKAELADAPRLLRTLDEDEDEALTAAEVLAVRVPAVPPTSAGARAAADRARPDAVLRLTLGKGGAAPALVGGRGARVRLGRPWRLELPGAVLTLPDGAGAGPADFEATRRFYLAQFRAVLGEKRAVGKAALEEAVGAEVLTALFDHADRNGDGKLTPAELTAFLDLVERGVRSQVVLTVRQRGRNLFDALDADGDGRLDLRELTRAGRLLSGAQALTRDALPWQLRLAARSGPAGPAFGPVALAEGKRPAPAPARAARGPRWFRAMDRNGDGFVSPREFLGPPELFRRLDLDGDGLISAAEAERAERERPGGPR